LTERHGVEKKSDGKKERKVQKEAGRNFLPPGRRSVGRKE